MRWQRVAQVALLAIVVVFVAAVAASLRKQKGTTPPEEPPPPPAAAKGSELYNPKGATIERFDGDRKVLEAKLGPHTKFPDGRLMVTGFARVLTNRDGKNLVIESKEADIKLKQQEPPGVETATFRGDVVLTTADGLEVKSAEATYSESDGIVRIPGAVNFKKDRMSGAGQGATYDRNRDVLWILDKAVIAVAPDASGQGGMDGSAATAGLARPDHYVKLSREAHINSGGRAMQADDITITLTPDNERVQMMQLRANSRISGGQGGPQSMVARDIDLIYAADGRTLQTSNLMEQAAVEMAGTSGGKKITAQTINIGMGPDGSTVTHLAANQNVQVDIPSENNAPAKQIRSAALVSSGAPNVGLKTATFTGKVDFRETQAATAKTPAIDRTARSETLVVETKPGLGAIEKADFRGNVKFVDAPSLQAEAMRGIYYIEKDRVELMPSEDPGPSALINDGRISVSARTIDFTIGSRDMNADTKVKSTILVKKDRTGRGQQSRVPSVFKSDEPAFVTANKLSYQGSASTATYTGNVNLWQGNETRIKGDKIVLDDKSGNLTANGNVVTELFLDETNATTGQKTRSQMLGKADAFAYDDARRLAIYTTTAHINGRQGDITANRIELFLKPAGSNELERAEAYAKGPEAVIVKEGVRTATGTHLTYTAADEQYPDDRHAGDDGGGIRRVVPRRHRSLTAILPRRRHRARAARRQRDHSEQDRNRAVRVAQALMATLHTRELTKSYSGRTVVRGVSLEIASGEVVGLLGPNGAGKTTTFAMVVGLTSPDSGRVLLDGSDVTNDPMYIRARKGIGYLPQEASIFRGLTVEENLNAILETIDLNRRGRRARLRELLAELGLTPLAKSPAYTLSGGERRRVEITRALVISPKFMLLDEPFAGIDPIAVTDIQKIIFHLKSRGIGVLITDHNVRETLRITDRAYIVHDGVIFRSGTPQSLADDEEVKRIYLGTDFRLD